nr:MAG TPA: hypothetical protein [Caudoviricetes sp.]
MLIFTKIERSLSFTLTEAWQCSCLSGHSFISANKLNALSTAISNSGCSSEHIHIRSISPLCRRFSSQTSITFTTL